MDYLIANAAESTLTAPIAAADLSCTIQAADASKFPAPAAGEAFLATLVRKNTGEREIVKCTARAAGVLTITRAQEGTAALSFVAGDIVSVRLTAGLLDRVRQGTRQGAAVASANDLTLDPTRGYVQVTGTTQINRIASASWDGGARVTLKFNGALTVKHNQAAGGGFVPIFLAAGADLARTAGQTLTLVYDETDAKFYQV